MTSHPPDSAKGKAEHTQYLRCLAAGDRAAFWPLWRQHNDYLYRRCLIWMGGNPNDAEEALSRATLKAWEKLPVYADRIENLRAWLTRMTHNLCVDMHRERGRAAMPVGDIEELIASGSIRSRMESPETVLLRQELNCHLRTAISELPAGLREPFVLHHCQEQPYTQIASYLGLTNANARKRVQQARSQLKRRLSRYLNGREPAIARRRQNVPTRTALAATAAI
ncbi:RNA polymerase sigma factor [Rubidibacter lacunae]|uniref:RNA polymerase sigma factor n=1 Tax=Rubidibacter lacunae TaxID=582514 RepID=UPI0008FEDFDB|nr:RNA polymerase sigma factor [Rubidibacter lacunae]